MGESSDAAPGPVLTEEGQRHGRLESMWVTVGGLGLHARVSRDAGAASAMPIVLVHGWVASSRVMVPLALALAPFSPVYAPDLPGFGRSDKPRGVLGVPELADALAGWMGAVGLQRAALLGHSLGAQVVVELAVRKPERVALAVLASPSTDPGARTMPRLLVRWLRNLAREPFGLAPVFARDTLDAGLRRAVGTVLHMLDDHIEDKLPRMRMPTLLISGANDPLVPVQWAEELARLLLLGRLRLIPAAPHTLNYLMPDELADVVRAFVHEQCEEVPSGREAVLSATAGMAARLEGNVAPATSA